MTKKYDCLQSDMQIQISRLNFLPFTFIEKKSVVITMDFTALIFCGVV